MLTIGFSELIYGMGALIACFLAAELYMDYRWSRVAQTMHAKRRK